MNEAVRPAPIAQEANTKLAMWVFLGGEVVFFTALILLLVLTRFVNTGYQEQFRGFLSIPIIAGNTFVLVTSSYFVVRSLEAIREGDARSMRLNMFAVLALGLLFLGGQAFEWTSLFRDGVDYSTTFGMPFFTVTGTHGLHVFIGCIWVVFLLLGHGRIPFTKDNHLAVENFGLYWHFVDIVWIVLFTLIYLI
jgi:heme/copper-type cytochrome/quinol oxidase subunit 3